MAAIAGASTVSSMNGTGSDGCLRPGTAATDVVSTTSPFSSSASSTAGTPVEPQSTRVTDDTLVGNVASTGMACSVAIAFRMPLRFVAMCGKNMIRPAALLFVGSAASLNTTPFSVQVGMGLPISACSKSITTSAEYAAGALPIRATNALP